MLIALGNLPLIKKLLDIMDIPVVIFSFDDQKIVPRLEIPGFVGKYQISRFAAHREKFPLTRFNLYKKSTLELIFMVIGESGLEINHFFRPTIQLETDALRLIQIAHNSDWIVYRRFGRQNIQLVFILHSIGTFQYKICH